MPTGYTAAIKDGITFDQFAMGCARGFGALIMMRDLPASAPIPERFEPSDYHAKALEAARKSLASLELMALAECTQNADDAYQAEAFRRLDCLEENRLLLKAYRAMLDNARTWIAPSKEHDGLKEFMINQIEESIKWDDNTEYFSKPIVRLTGQDWLDEQKAKAIKDIAYHKEQHAQEVERTNQRNEWLRLLRESLAVQS